MVPSVQKVCKALGEEGCYLLAIAELIERVGGVPVDPSVLYQRCFHRGFIELDCLVKNPAEIVKIYLGGEWEVSKVGVGYTPGEKEWEILRFERKEEKLGKTEIFSHFVLGDGRGRVLFDPLGDSLTVRNGTLVSKRIFRRIS